MSLESQLAMNSQTWQALQKHGVTEESKLRLEFYYDAPGEPQAVTLASFLDATTDYDVAVSSSAEGLLRKKVWGVMGVTQETTVSLAILDDWVRWMVAAGADAGCEFDGWGATATP